MVRSHVAVATLAALALAVSACSAPSEGDVASSEDTSASAYTTTIHVDETDANAVVDGTIGDILVVALPGSAGTGFVWSVSAADATLGAATKRTVRAPSPTPTTGGPETSEFTWDTRGARSAGSRAITLAYARPWETTTAPVRTFSFTLNLRARSSGPTPDPVPPVDPSNRRTLEGPSAAALYDAASQNYHYPTPSTIAIRKLRCMKAVLAVPTTATCTGERAGDSKSLLLSQAFTNAILDGLAREGARDSAFGPILLGGSRVRATDVECTRDASGTRCSLTVGAAPETVAEANEAAIYDRLRTTGSAFAPAPGYAGFSGQIMCQIAHTDGPPAACWIQDQAVSPDLVWDVLKANAREGLYSNGIFRTTTAYCYTTGGTTDPLCMF